MSSIPIWTILGQAFRLVGPLFTVVYPALASFEALESPQDDDDKQWLTYWTILGFLSLIESILSPVLAWISAIYYPAKFLFMLWLELPQFRGASFLYKNYIRPRALEARKRVYDQFGDQSYLFKSQPLPAKKAE